MQQIRLVYRLLIGAAALFLLLALLAIPFSGADRAARFERLQALPGGAVRAVAVHPREPGTILVSMTADLLRTRNHGVTWERAELSDEIGGTASRIQFDPQNAEIGYAQGAFGLAVSQDGGATWNVARDAVALPNGFSFVVSPLNGTVYVPGPERILYGEDQGTSWQELSSLPQAGDVLSLAPHPGVQDILYVGTTEGLYISGDHGQSWLPSQEGLPQGPVEFLVFDSHVSSRLYAAMPQGLFVSDDVGASWHREEMSFWDLVNADQQLASLPRQDKLLVVMWGLSDEQGALRLPELSSDETLLSLGGDAANSQMRYAGTSRTLYGSRDSGVHWEDMGSHQSDGSGQPLTVLSPGPRRLFDHDLALYLGGFGLLLGFAAAALVWFDRTREPRSSVSERGARGERWDDVVADVLMTHQKVTPERLEHIPVQARVHAMTRYVDNHRHQALIFQDDPPLIRPVREAKLSEFGENWSTLVRETSDAGDPVPAASRLVEQLCDLLGFNPLERRIYRSLAGYMVEAPTLRLSLPASFPIILILKQDIGHEDIRDIRVLMSALHAVSFFALLVIVSDSASRENQVVRLQQLIRGGAEDLIVLDYHDLFNLFLAVDAESALVRQILDQVDLTIISPYVLSGPVPSKMFFGRDYEIKAILRTVQDKSFAIVGGRKIGKTSILNKVHRLLEQTEGFYPIYLDCHHVGSHADFFEALSVMVDTGVGTATPDMLRRIVVRLRSRSSAAGQVIVFLLDEVDFLLRYDLEHDALLFRVFRSLSQEGLCRFVLCGERILDRSLHDPSLPLFNFCSALKLGYLQERDVERIVREPMKEMGISFEDPDLLPKEIIKLSGCHPNIVQAICQFLIQHINERQDRVIRLQDLNQVKQSADFRDLFFEVTWGNATTLERLITVLMAEQEHFTAGQVRQALETIGVYVDDADVTRLLGNLTLCSVIKRQGQSYEYTSGAFAQILRETGFANGFRQGLLDKLEEEGW